MIQILGVYGFLNFVADRVLDALCVIWWFNGCFRCVSKWSFVVNGIWVCCSGSFVLHCGNLETQFDLFGTQLPEFFFFLALVFDVFVFLISWVSGYFGGVAEKGFIVKWNLGVLEFLYCVIEL